jgi:hypothetical protein
MKPHPGPMRFTPPRSRFGASVAATRRKKRVERAGYTICEFSDSFQIDDSTAFRRIRRGLVRAVQIGGLTIIPAVERERLLVEGAPLRRGRSTRTTSGQFVKEPQNSGS